MYETLLVKNKLFYDLHKVNDKVAANVARVILWDLDDRGVIGNSGLDMNKHEQECAANFTIREIADYMDRHPYKARNHRTNDGRRGPWYGVGKKGYDMLVEFLKNYSEEKDS